MPGSKLEEIRHQIEQIKVDLSRRLKATRFSEFEHIYQQRQKLQRLEEQLAELDPAQNIPLIRLPSSEDTA